ncbi:hypothetical protein MLD38_032663 [Melastoma candidum]|uniref:Uncharacterized protein n=1 Tax=Melastoma candidum TaxID=119954 RepID=A0ACB9M4N5_9MYRT|nr:hypothetical protein MLD38_032663 [Melastoma candidum]
MFGSSSSSWKGSSSVAALATARLMNRDIRANGTSFPPRPTWLCLLMTLALLQLMAVFGEAFRVKEATFLSPKFVLNPGSVADKYYHDIDFPRGHIALKSFTAEVVDEEGNPVSLKETYLHHWVVDRYYQRKDAKLADNDSGMEISGPERVVVRNGGICQNLGQYFGLGSETRRTETFVPDPYGIEVGNQEEIPDGYEERWFLNVHAIDTRGVEDGLGCTECRCDLYNVTQDQYGRPLAPGYKGGLYCCYDHTQCRLMEGFRGTGRGLYLRYTVHWVDWESSILPVTIYIFDVTDNPSQKSLGPGEEHHCRIEYDVENRFDSAGDDNSYIDSKRTELVFPASGYVIYGVAHQHSGGLGSNLYGEDNRLVCSSVPTYGEGNEAGDEAGYIVGMSTCYPQFGSVKISKGEVLLLESNYSRKENHTGVMGLFYILIADELPNSESLLHLTTMADKAQMHWGLFVSACGALALVGLFLTGIAIVTKMRKEDGYQPLAL